jgi:hypothetical protein
MIFFSSLQGSRMGWAEAKFQIGTSGSLENNTPSIYSGAMSGE